MYSSGAMVLVEGLAEGSGIVLANLEDGPFLAYQGDFPGEEAFPLPDGLEGRAASGRIMPATLLRGGSSWEIRVFSISDPGLLGLDTGPSLGHAWISRGMASELQVSTGSSILVATPLATVELNFSRVLSPAIQLPEQWIMTSDADLLVLSPLPAEAYGFVLLEDRRDATTLEARGFTILSLSSTLEFFHQGMEEARRVVQGIVAVSSVTIAAVAFTLLSLEVRYRRRETVTLRALGMDRWGFARLYGLQLAFILLAGTILGTSMGIVAANALVSFAPFFGMPTIIRPAVTLQGILLPFLSSMVAGLVGGTVTISLTVRRIARAHGD